MRLEEVMDNLELSQDTHDVYIEVAGVIYDIAEVKDDSQGVVLVAKTDDKDMR